MKLNGIPALAKAPRDDKFFSNYIRKQDCGFNLEISYFILDISNPAELFLWQSHIRVMVYLFA